ncbi:MAG: shikimate dehydrogenase, partial [Betaproteobacteria bacterium]|nr:shikimate dehydrogenase [Betaproteobacteria bacterium]
MNIDGNTELIAHIGYPTHSFKSPLIYNPYFEKEGINALVVPMGCKGEHYPAFLKSMFQLSNIRGALITMPHKVTTVGLLDEVTPTVKVAGACNAVKMDAQGRLVGDMFDGAGFVRGVQRKGFNLTGKRVMVVGTGGVGSAIAASMAAEKIAAISLFGFESGAALATVV